MRLRIRRLGPGDYTARQKQQWRDWRAARAAAIEEVAAWIELESKWPYTHPGALADAIRLELKRRE